jgi:hypothetical protein
MGKDNVKVTEVESRNGLQNIKLFFPTKGKWNLSGNWPTVELMKWESVLFVAHKARLASALCKTGLTKKHKLNNEGKAI